MKVNPYVPPVPPAGVPDKMPDWASKLSPLGSGPEIPKVGFPPPHAVTWKLK